MFTRDASFDDLVADLFGNLRSLQPQAQAANGQWPMRRLALATDIHETEDAFVFEADLPGVKADDLDIEIDQKVLTIKATREMKNTEHKEGFHRTERAYGVFERRFTLGERVDPDTIEATLDDGVLTIRMAKAEDQKPRRIQVKGTEQLSNGKTAETINVDTEKGKNEDAEVKELKAS